MSPSFDGLLGDGVLGLACANLMENVASNLKESLSPLWGEGRGNSAPQEPQASARRAPQPRQNLAWAGLSCWHRGHFMLYACCWSIVSGNVKVKVEPVPTSLFTQILPPWSSMNFRERASPRPVPSDFLSAAPTCRNSSNTAS